MTGNQRSSARRCPIWVIVALSLLFAITIPETLAQLPSFQLLQNSPNPLQYFPGDYYKLTGSPYITASLDRSTVYQSENTSIILSLKNRGNVSSIRVNEEPASSSPEEVYAARMELDLERGRTAAQDISVRLYLPYPPNMSPLEIRREVAYSPNLREGQVSSALLFPAEVYKNTRPGRYTIYAIINYSYQSDVAVKAHSSRPQNPDVYYLYSTVSQVLPLEFTVERRSGAEFEVSSISPEYLRAGSRDNIVQITVENVGHMAARDLVARLRPESGIYVSVDESPIPELQPGESSELVYKVDVSRDAVPGKRYRFNLIFEFSDSLREDLTDTEHTYIMIEPGSTSPIILAVILALGIAAVALIAIRRRRGAR